MGRCWCQDRTIRGSVLRMLSWQNHRLNATRPSLASDRLQLKESDAPVLFQFKLGNPWPGRGAPLRTREGARGHSIPSWSWLFRNSSWMLRQVLSPLLTVISQTQRWRDTMKRLSPQESPCPIASPRNAISHEVAHCSWPPTLSLSLSKCRRKGLSQDLTSLPWVDAPGR